MIPYSKQSIQDSDIKAVTDVLSSPWLTQGPKVPDFEINLKKALGVNHAVTCSSGTAALQLAYSALGVNSSSLGIVPAVTFAATANAYLNLGAKVIFCDVNPDDGIINLESLEVLLKNLRSNNKFNKRVISPVSLAGKTAPLEEIFDLVQKYEFNIVEDASHSPGAYLANKNGSKTYSASCKWTDASTVSFHPVKHICCGEGGALLTNSKEIAHKAELLRSHGITRETDQAKERPWYYEQIELGWNFRLTDIQAALGIEQLNRLSSSITQRHRVAERYKRLLSQDSFTEWIELPDIDPGHALHLYVIRFKQANLRDPAYRYLKERGIITQVHYIPLYHHPFHKGNNKPEDFPGTEDYFQGCLSIPMHPNLTNGDQDKVVEELAGFLLQNGL